MAGKKQKAEKELQIAIDKKTGKWVSIFEVPTGLACNCTYLDTGFDLVAKNKNKKPDVPLRPGQNMAHFAIAPRQDFKDKPSPESTIHKLAKEVFSENKVITIPELWCEEGKLTDSMEVRFDSVTVEDTSLESEFGFKPDAVAEKNAEAGGNKKLLVEFKKTHAVDAEKTEKIERCNISCVEIDLIGIPQLDRFFKPNRNGIQERLLNPMFATWIYNIEEEERRSKLLMHLEEQRKLELEEQRKLELEEQRKEEEKLKAKWEEQNEEYNRKRSRKVADSENSRIEFKEALTKRKQKILGLNRSQILKLIESEKTEIELDEIPDYCNIVDVRKYVDCPMFRTMRNRCTLVDCYFCSFFYTIKVVPKSKSEFVICSFHM